MREVAILLLIAGLAPEMSRDASGSLRFNFLAPAPLAAQVAPGMGRFVSLYPILAGIALLVIDRMRTLRSYGKAWAKLAAGALLPLVVIPGCARTTPCSRTPTSCSG